MGRSIALLFGILATLASAVSTARLYELTVNYGFTPPKGYPQLSITINGERPGPTISVHQGESLIIKLTNGLPEENIAIQWNGLRPIGGGVTGPIPPGETYMFRFVADRLGTYPYYSRFKMQRDAGLQGSIHVLPPDVGRGLPFKEGAEEAGKSPSQFTFKEGAEGADRAGKSASKSPSQFTFKEGAEGAGAEGADRAGKSASKSPSQFTFKEGAEGAGAEGAEEAGKSAGKSPSQFTFKEGAKGAGAEEAGKSAGKTPSQFTFKEGAEGAGADGADEAGKSAGESPSQFKGSGQMGGSDRP